MSMFERPHIFAIYLLALAILSYANPGRAAGLDRLLDGRVVISLKGYHFAFPAEGVDLDHIRFNEVSLQDRVTLRQLIASPDAQRRIGNQKANVPISIGVAPDKGLFLGKFDRSQIHSLSFGFSVGDDQRGCEVWKKEFARVRAKLVGGSSRPIGNRWNRTQDGTYLIYTYDGTKLQDIRDGLTNIHCDALSYCGSSICLAPKLGFSFEFSSKSVPIDRWVTFLTTVDSIISNILEAEGPRGGQR